MQAVRFEQFGPLENTLLFAEIPVPQLGDGDVMVRVEAAAINPSDVKNIQGMMRDATTLPRTPGRDFAGTVVQGPSDLIGKAVWGTGGDIGFSRDGSHAEYLVLPRDAVSVRPNNLSAAEAASVGVGFLTAWVGLIDRAELKPGETVLVVGGTGAVGTAVAQIARWKGASTVLSTVRFKGEPSVTPALPGVDTILNLAQGHPLDSQVRDATNGRGVDVVFNTVGGHTFDAGLSALADGGRMAVISAIEDPRVSFNLLDFYRRDLQILGVNSLHQTAVDGARILNELTPGFESGALLPPRVRTYPFAQAVGAYELVALGTAGEKIVLVNE